MANTDKELYDFLFLKILNTKKAEIMLFFLTKQLRIYTIIHMPFKKGVLLKLNNEPLAQTVEQQPFKLWVAGSSPARLTRLRLSGPSRLGKLRLAVATTFRSL